MSLRACAAVVIVAIVAAAPALAGPAAFGLGGYRVCGTAHLSWTSSSGAVSYSVVTTGNVVLASGLASTSYDAASSSGGLVIRAYDAAGYFTESNSISPPNLPCGTNYVVGGGGYCDASGGSSAHLYWEPVANSTNWSVERDGVQIASGLAPSTRTYDDHSVSAGSHNYTIRTSSPTTGQLDISVLGVSVPSCSAPPSAPSGVSAIPACSNGSALVHVTWSAGGNATSYRVYRNGVYYSQPSVTSFDDPAVTPGTNYTYVVQSVNKSGTAESGPASATPATCVPPPGGFVSSASEVCTNGTPSVHVTWNPASGATSYSISRNNVTLQTGLTGSSYDDPNVTVGQSYTYAVTAVNSGGSTVAPPTSVTIDACPTPPPAPTLSASTFCSAGNKPAVHLSWTGSAGATYTILRNGLPIAGPQSGTTYDDTSVAAQQYTYSIRASNGSGTSDSNSVTIAVPSDACPPAAPTLSANVTCNGGTPVVALLWSVSAGASSYTVLRNGASIGSMTATSYNDSNVTPGQTYTYMVRAVNAAGTADSNSAQVSILFDACGLPPGSFTLSATPFCDTTGTPVTAVRLTWTASAGATSYAILRGGSQITTTTGTTYVDRNVSGSLQYVVRASNNIGTAQATASANVDPNLCDGFTPASDLAVTAVSAPSSASPGSTIRVQYTLLNRGTAAGSSTVRVRLGDLLLASKPSPTLAPGASIADSQFITLPASLAPGTYYAFVSIDTSTARSNEIAVAPAACGATCGALVADTAAANVPVVFMLSAPPCDGATMLWTFGDGSSSTVPAATHTYAAPGTYVWTVTVSSPGQSNAQSCNASGTIAITNPPPPRPRPARH